jgi:hypothetical protein
MKRFIWITIMVMISAHSNFANNIIITNKEGASFDAKFGEILPNTPRGIAVKVVRSSDRRTFTIPLSTLSENSLIEIIKIQSKPAGFEPIDAFDAPPQNNSKNIPKTQRVDGYKFVESIDNTAEDIDLNIEFESVKKDENQIEILGRIKNNSDKTFVFCNIQVELRDGSNKLIARDDTYTDPSDIRSGQISTFEIWILDDALEKARIREIIYRVKGRVEN